MNWTWIIVFLLIDVAVLLLVMGYLARQKMVIESFEKSQRMQAYRQGGTGPVGPQGMSGPPGPPGPPGESVGCDCKPLGVNLRLEELEATVKSYNDRFRRVERKAGLHV